MDEQLDDDLKKHIAEVFENYEDTSADEGWLLLREKFPEKAKRRIAAWVWWAPAAAILLLFLGILWFRPNPEKHQQQTAAIKTKPAPQPNIAAIKKDTITKANIAVQQHNSTSLVNNAQSGKSIPKNVKNEPPVSTLSNHNRETLAATSQNNNIQLTNNQDAILSKSNSSAQNPPLQEKSMQAMNTPQSSASIAVTPPVKRDTANPSAPKPQAVASNPGVDMLAKQPDKGNKNTFAENSISSHKTEKLLNRNKAVQLGVYATTYFNYAKGSTSQFNIGGGITSDIALSRKFKLSTGLAIGQNTLNYANQPMISSATMPSEAVSLSSYLPASLNLSGPPSFKNYNANLVGLDVPLNLKYVFAPEKSETYILAGFSSGTFINETYTYSYRNPSFFSANISQIQDQSTRNSFNGFYFAKTLNFAMGTGYTIGGSRLIIEPFFKYPIDGLGTQQIKFGSGGVNLKFSFQPLKR